MKISHIKTGTIIMGCLGILLIMYLLFSFASRKKINDSFPSLNTTFLSHRMDNIPKYVKISNAYALLQSGAYQEALALISGERSEDYYNRAVIQTIGAYELASRNDFSEIKLANDMIKDATHNFFLAEKLQTNTHLENAITKNITTVTELALIINAKTCYSISTETIDNISGMQQKISQLQEIIKKESQAVQASQAPNECKQRWTSEIQKSRENAQNLSNILHNENAKEKDILQQKRSKPVVCLQEQDDTLIVNIQKTMQKIEEFTAQHTDTLAMRGSKNTEQISKLCQAKNDAQINQGLQNTIDQLLNSFNTTSSLQDFNTSTNSPPSYLPLDDDEQKLLESSDKKSKIRIRQLQRLKADPEYNSMQYIQTLFQEFYGNTGDFVQ